MTEEATPESLWGEGEGLSSDAVQRLASFDPRIRVQESVRGKIARRRREAENDAKAARGKSRVKLYGDEIGGALHDVLDPDLDFLETDTGRDVDRKGILVQVLDDALQSKDPAERHRALRLWVDTIERLDTHRHQEPRY